MPFSTIPIWVNELKTLVPAMYTKDVTVIHNAKTNLSFLFLNQLKNMKVTYGRVENLLKEVIL